MARLTTTTVNDAQHHPATDDLFLDINEAEAGVGAGAERRKLSDDPVTPHRATRFVVRDAGQRHHALGLEHGALCDAVLEAAAVRGSLCIFVGGHGGACLCVWVGCGVCAQGGDEVAQCLWDVFLYIEHEVSEVCEEFWVICGCAERGGRVCARAAAVRPMRWT